MVFIFNFYLFIFFYFWTVPFPQMVVVGFPSPLTQPEAPGTVPGVHDQSEPLKSRTVLERDYGWGSERDFKRCVPITVI